jgi:hypothetical protein
LIRIIFSLPDNQDSKTLFCNNFIDYFIQSKYMKIMNVPSIKYLMSETCGFKEPEQGLQCIQNFLKLVFSRIAPGKHRQSKKRDMTYEKEYLQN